MHTCFGLFHSVPETAVSKDWLSGFDGWQFHLRSGKNTFRRKDSDLEGTSPSRPLPPTRPTPAPQSPTGTGTPELALTCGRQGAPSGSERRAYAMPATSSAQPCMKYEIKKKKQTTSSCPTLEITFTFFSTPPSREACFSSPSVPAEEARSKLTMAPLSLSNGPMDRSQGNNIQEPRRQWRSTKVWEPLSYTTLCGSDTSSQRGSAPPGIKCPLPRVHLLPTEK